MMLGAIIGVCFLAICAAAFFSIRRHLLNARREDDELRYEFGAPDHYSVFHEDVKAP